jgi:hypothetical protein
LSSLTIDSAWRRIGSVRAVPVEEGAACSWPAWALLSSWQQERFAVATSGLSGQFILALLSRQALVRVRGRLLSADKLFEAWVMQVAPAWLVNLTTSL